MHTTRIFITVMAATVILPLAASGQTVIGVVVEHPGGRPVAEATVTLLDQRGNADVTSSRDREGVFELRALDSGQYRIRVEQPGYATTLTPPLELTVGEERRVVVLLGRNQLEIAPLVIHGESTPEPRFVRELMERVRSGGGTFLLRPELDEDEGLTLAQILARTPGVRVQHTSVGDAVVQLRHRAAKYGRPGSTQPGGRAPHGGSDGRAEYARANACPPALYLNGSPVYLPHPDEQPELMPLELIRRFMAHRGGELEAVEIYREAAHTPAAYAAMVNCGVIAVWLRH
jgi:hypothetical protein